MKVIVEEIADKEEIEVIIRCSSNDDRVKQIIQQLDRNDNILLCKQDKGIHQVNIENIMYIESIDEKTFVYLQDEVFENQNKLYEIEDILKDKKFVRISKSVILHLTYLKSVKALINGKYEATLMNGEKLIINRSYMPSFKQAFGL